MPRQCPLEDTLLERAVPLPLSSRPRSKEKYFSVALLSLIISEAIIPAAKLPIGSRNFQSMPAQN